MLPVEFKKWHVPCHYSINVSVNLKKVQRRLSYLRKGRVALSDLRVNGL